MAKQGYSHRTTPGKYRSREEGLLKCGGADVAHQPNHPPMARALLIGCGLVAATLLLAVGIGWTFNQVSNMEATKVYGGQHEPSANDDALPAAVMEGKRLASVPSRLRAAHELRPSRRSGAHAGEEQRPLRKSRANAPPQRPSRKSRDNAPHVQKYGLPRH